jgi:hypothetical protein
MNPHKFQASHKTAPLYQTLSGTWTRACWSTKDLQLSVSLRPTCCHVYVLRASPMVLSMWSCTSVIGGTKSYVCRFHSGKWFWLSIIAYVAWLLKGAAALCTCRKECNKCDLTAAQYFSLAHHNDWSRWFAISSPPPICCPSFSFIGGVAKEYITILGCEKYFCRVTYWAPLEMHLEQLHPKPPLRFLQVDIIRGF